MPLPFLLFYGDTYYPNGGWDDFKGAFATVEQATEAAHQSKSDWWQVVDVREHKVVAAHNPL